MMMTAMTTVIIIIAMLMSFVPTTMAEAEEILGMLEEVMTDITVNTEVASKVFTNNVFSIHKKNNQQNFKDIFMKEDEVDVVEKVSSFDSLSLLNNNEPSMMTTRPLSLWWFTKEVLRRTTEEGTQLDEEENEGAEAEAERRSTNRGIKVRARGGSLVEEGAMEEFEKERTTLHTRFISLLLYVPCGE